MIKSENLEPLSEAEAYVFRDLAAAFYKRVTSDSELQTLFATTDQGAAAERLARYFIECFGGPPLYSDFRGSLDFAAGVHQGMNINEEQRRRWLWHMFNACDEAGLTPDLSARFKSFVTAISYRAATGSRLHSGQ